MHVPVEHMLWHAASQTPCAVAEHDSDSNSPSGLAEELGCLNHMLFPLPLLPLLPLEDDSDQVRPRFLVSGDWAVSFNNPSLSSLSQSGSRPIFIYFLFVF